VKRSSRLCIALVLLCAPAHVSADSKRPKPPLTDRDIPQLLRTDYYGAYIAGNKIGWAKMSLTRLDTLPPGYLAQLEMTVKVTAAGAKREIRTLQSEEFELSAPYTFRGGCFRRTEGNSGRETTVTRSFSGGFEAITRSGGETARKQIASIDYTLADRAAISLWVLKNPKEGDRLPQWEFSFNEFRVGMSIYKLAATRTAVANGVTLTYHEVTDAMKSNSTLARYDAKGGQILSMQLSGLIELRVEPEAMAKNVEFGADFFELGKVKVDRRLGNCSRITSLVLETGGHDLNLKPGPFQAVARNGSGVYTVKLGWDYGTVSKATPADIWRNLSETPDYPITNPKIQALARGAVADAQTTKEKVKRLVHFVAGYIEPSYTTRPLSVMDVVHTRRGACTEYAKLYTTLARAAGVPAREVSGLMYIGDDERAFGMHAWNEIVLNGQWLPVDAAWNQTEPDPTHISFGSTLDDQAMNTLAAFNKMSFRVVDVKYQK
jgi:protein-glutamine gamma-glutamyltransferase